MKSSFREEKDQPVLVTGTTGMVGCATLKLLKKYGFSNLLAPSRCDLDLVDQNAVFDYFNEHRPRYVLMLAAKVGGIAANSEDMVGFTDDNLRISLNLYSACHKFQTKKNLFLGSSCIYPRETPQPMREEAIMTGSLEPTNEGYALSKIVGLRLARYYKQQYAMNTVCPMPCNIYGTGDHFDFHKAHVLSSLVRRFVDAVDEHVPRVIVWGTGAARREFIHVDDVARAIIFFMEHIETPDHINLGTGVDIAIRDLAHLISKRSGFTGEIVFDTSKPDGMLLKRLEISKLKDLGFVPFVSLEEGIERTIGEYKAMKSTGMIS